MTNLLPAKAEHCLVVSDGIRLVADAFGAMTDRVPLVCIPGMTRTARDFTDLASELARDRLLIAIELRGRGRSDYDPTAASYRLDVYARDVLEVCDALSVAEPVFVGTSLGGQVAMHVGAIAPTRVAGIVLNDVGPELAPEGLARIASHAGELGPVANWQDAVIRTRMANESRFPGLSDEEWMQEARKRYREAPDGRLVSDHDPAIFNGPASPEDPWWIFDLLQSLPLLLLRGEFSDLLAVDTVDIMRALHPGIRTVEIPNRGHTPLLSEPVALRAIDAFLKVIDDKRAKS